MRKLAICLFLSAILFGETNSLPPRERQRRIRASFLSGTTTTTTTTPQPSPSPYKYAFAAGRHPGGKPDRYIEQQGDEKGVVTGSYTYLDPNWNWQKVSYVADPETGFHVLDDGSNASSDPVDTPAVAKAKAKHAALFKAIAERNRQQNPLIPAVVASVPDETDAVKQKRAEHAEEFARIAAEHARIAEEQSRLFSLASQFGEIYERK